VHCDKEKNINRTKTKEQKKKSSQKKTS